MKNQVETNETKVMDVENLGRRKAMKVVVGGVATVAAYNLLPAKWGTPLVESVFLPAHAATSGNTGNTGNAGGNAVLGKWTHKTSGVTWEFKDDGILKAGAFNSQWSLKGNTLTVSDGLSAEKTYTVKGNEIYAGESVILERQ